MSSPPPANTPNETPENTTTPTPTPTPTPPKKATVETVTYEKNDRFQICTPQISLSTSIKNFTIKDFDRVLDFENLENTLPKDSFMKILVNDSFPECYFILRGNFILYKFEEDDRHRHKYPQLGCIPLGRTRIEDPPGGRRVFREHADTEAKTGYEFAIMDDEKGIPDSMKRPTAYIVAETMSQRSEWAEAIKIRSELTRRDTQLRPSSAKENWKNIKKRSALMSNLIPSRREEEDDDMDLDFTTAQREKKPEFLDDAIQEFGTNDFNDEKYVNRYFLDFEDFEVQAGMHKLEQYHGAVKQGLRGMVLEQYEYFVEASREMTVMGKEVSELRVLVEGQVRCIETMKKLDFGVMAVEGEEEGYGSSEEGSIIAGEGMLHNDADDEESSAGSSAHSSDEELPTIGANVRRSRRSTVTEGNPLDDVVLGAGTGDGNERGAGSEQVEIQIPNWLTDAVEELSAMIRLSQYTDAVEAVLNTKAEIQDIFSQHDKPTSARINSKQQTQLERILKSTLLLADRMGDRLAEGLRRKNEALRQAAKRERADPLSELAPLLSPICLNDDAAALNLLVKLGRTQDAATAYSARRSLLLMESLGERPISSSGTMDVVIYAAQLSQGFFSCLATSVEGFLDLFLEGGPSQTPEGGMLMGGEDFGVEENMSILTGQTSSKVPAGALASIVLWCDSELSKFAAVFGGQKILGHLALSPPQMPVTATVSEEAEKQEEKDRAKNEERQTAIEVAAKCIDQAFQLASENLDSIGLPLTPRLADYIRGRLKGCEAEMAIQLQGKWDYIIYDWLMPSEMENGEHPRRARAEDIRPSASYDE